MKRTIFISALGCLLAASANLHAQADPPGDAPDRAEAHDQAGLTFRFDPAGDPGDRGLSSTINLGALQEGAEAEGTEPTTTAATTAQDDFWTRDKMLGDWWGARTDLAQKGITLNMRLTQFYQGVVSGGSNTTSRYGGVLDNILAIDGHKLGLWEGFFLNMHVTTQFGESIVGDAGAFALPNTAM